MPSILLVGLNHRTADIELREQLSRHGQALDAMLGSLHSSARPISSLQEMVVLSTCNRLEIYATAEDALAGWQSVAGHLRDVCHLPATILEKHLYFRQDRSAVEHLMCVAAGLDSMILGEPQILGQVADAYAAAQANGTSGPILSHLFTQAIHCGKRARAETGIGAHTTSISHAAAQLAASNYGALGDSSVLIVGAGKMAALAAEAFAHHGVNHIFCTNRTQARAEALAAHVGGQALPWAQLPASLAAADVVVSATSAQHIVLTSETVTSALALRQAAGNPRPLVMLDIALPRDIDPTVDGLDGVHRYDIDHLRGTVDDNLARRQAAVPAVEAIIAAEVASFLDWQRERQVVPALVEFRRRAETLADAELQRTLRRLHQADRADSRVEQEVAQLTHRIIAKLLHEPTVRLKAQAANGNGAVYAQILEELFALAAGNAQPESPNSNGSVEWHL
jgi:glutamyl-tRNA reductase